MPLINFNYSPEATRWIAFFTGLVCAFSLLFAASTAVRSESTGTAIYQHGFRGSLRENVTRESEPTKFREAINQNWLHAGLFLCLSATGFYFFRKLST